MDQCQKAFETPRDSFRKSPVLVYPDPDKPYTLFTDALKYAWSAVLTQEHITIIDNKSSYVNTLSPVLVVHSKEAN